MKLKHTLPLILAALLASSPALAADKKGGKKDAHAGHGSSATADSSGDSKSGGHSMGMMHMPGMVMEMCKDGGDKPPHFCEPSYMTMSSVLGVKISEAMPMGDKSLMLTLKAWGPLAGKPVPKLIVVGGGGDLAGAAAISGGWQDTTTVHLDLEGNASAWRAKGFHLHVFLNTGK